MGFLGGIGKALGGAIGMGGGKAMGGAIGGALGKAGGGAAGSAFSKVGKMAAAKPPMPAPPMKSRGPITSKGMGGMRTMGKR
jgi:hypothetical protein